MQTLHELDDSPSLTMASMCNFAPTLWLSRTVISIANAYRGNIKVLHRGTSAHLTDKADK